MMGCFPGGGWSGGRSGADGRGMRGLKFQRLKRNFGAITIALLAFLESFANSITVAKEDLGGTETQPEHPSFVLLHPK